jgi:hypothetical protein
MDHKHIEEAELVVRYLRGSLSEQEAEQFEEHFLDCIECIDRLETTRDFIEGLRFESGREKRRNFFAALIEWVSRPAIAPRWLAITTAAVVLASLLMTLLVLSRDRQSRAIAEQARLDSAEWERRYEEADRQRQQSEREAADRLSQLQAELDKKQTPQPAGSSSQQPQINMPIFVLKSLRGAGASGASNELRLPRPPASFVISLQLEGEQQYRDYRATIRDDHNRVLWKGSGLTRDRYNSLRVGFSSSFFRPGSYLLTLEGAGEGGVSRVIGEYSFYVVQGS